MSLFQYSNRDSIARTQRKSQNNIKEQFIEEDKEDLSSKEFNNSKKAQLFESNSLENFKEF